MHGVRSEPDIVSCAAPEVMQNAEDTEYGPAADIWSLGELVA